MTAETGYPRHVGEKVTVSDNDGLLKTEKKDGIGIKPAPEGPVGKYGRKTTEMLDGIDVGRKKRLEAKATRIRQIEQKERPIATALEKIEGDAMELSNLSNAALEIARRVLAGDKSNETLAKLETFRNSAGKRAQRLDEEMEAVRADLPDLYAEETFGDDDTLAERAERMKRKDEYDSQLKIAREKYFRAISDLRAKEFNQVEGYEEVEGGEFPGPATKQHAENPYYFKEYDPSEAVVIDLVREGYSVRGALNKKGKEIIMAKPGEETPVLHPILEKIKELEMFLVELLQEARRKGKGGKFTVPEKRWQELDGFEKAARDSFDGLLDKEGNGKSELAKKLWRRLQDAGEFVDTHIARSDGVIDLESVSANGVKEDF